MATYRILKPIAVDEKIGEHEEDVVTRHYPRRGVEVELTDEQAAPLLAAGRIEPVEAEVLPDVTVTVDGVDQGAGETGTRPDDSATGTAVASDGASVPDGDTEVKPAGRGRRGAAKGDDA